MPTVTVGVELIPALEKINPVMASLKPVQQQQVIELLLVTYLAQASHLRREQRLVVEGFCKHVWQFLDQAEKL